MKKAEASYKPPSPANLQAKLRRNPHRNSFGVLYINDIAILVVIISAEYQFTNFTIHNFGVFHCSSPFCG